MSKAFVTPGMLRWARERAGMSLDVFASKLNVTKAAICEWENGERYPTFKQAEKFAKATKIPFGYLFLLDPPTERMTLPDFRTTGSKMPLGMDFEDVLKDVVYKQDWFKEYRKNLGWDKLDFVGSQGKDTKPEEIAISIRKTLKIEIDHYRSFRKVDDYLANLIAQCEAAGIWVFKNSVVKNNNTRKLNVQEFRGFAISDPIAPVVFINASDAKTAQVFTLIHELAHIWLGLTGVSDPQSTERRVHSEEAKIERLCNQVAERFLTPKSEFLKLWDHSISAEENLSILSKEFKVSRAVIAFSSYSYRLVSKRDIDFVFKNISKYWGEAVEKSTGSGGSYYRTLKTRVGKTFFYAVISSAASGNLLIRDAGELLNTSPKVIGEAYRRHKGGEL
ncbi:hypothetical protein AZ09_03815 [Acetobacter aceti 1023]|nr:hypothetical protein AZ09_03815 [Acetobacter aceti 1023]